LEQVTYIGIAIEDAITVLLEEALQVISWVRLVVNKLGLILVI